MPNLSLSSDIIVLGKKSQFILAKKMFSEWILTGDKNPNFLTNMVRLYHLVRL